MCRVLEIHEAQRAVPLPGRYVAPGSLDEAVELLSSHGAAARLIAGGTDLMLELARGARSGVELLVDVSGMIGLDRIAYENGRVTLGPLVTHADVIASATMRAAGLPLAQACLEVGSPPLRNRATVVGNIVTASPANDTISALTALGADITMTSTRGERTVGIGEFISGFRQTVLEPDEMVTCVAFDALGASDTSRTDARTRDRRGVFVKLGLRRAQAISVVHAAVVVSFGPGSLDGRDGPGTTTRDDAGPGTATRRDADCGAAAREVTDLVVALGSVAPTVIAVPAAAEAARGRRLSEARADIVDAARRAGAPIDDLRGSAEYRSRMIGVVVDRAVAALADGAEADRWPHEPPRLAPTRPRHQASSASSAPAALTVSDADGPDRAVAVAAKAHSRPHASSPRTSLSGAGDFVTATVNGEQRRAAGAAGTTLMDWLRDDLGLTGTKEGCAEGECGACTVHLDGAAVLSCLVPAGRANGAIVTTVEGVASPAGGLHPFQQAMVDTGGAQCGFCTPGFVMSAVALLDEIAQPTAEQITMGLSGNLCRCTGYCSIIEAVRAVSGDAGAVRAVSGDAGAVRAVSGDAGADSGGLL